MFAVSDLHVDVGDGGGELGAVSIYWCDACPPHEEDMSEEEMMGRLAYRDLVVFPGKCGGRGVRIGVLRPGWVCVVLMSTRSCLHGGVCAQTPALEESPPLVLPDGMRHVRILTYPMRAIETLMQNLRDDTDALERVRAIMWGMR